VNSKSPESACFTHIYALITSLAPGTKFFVVCKTGAPNMEMLLKAIYELYTDFVLKNPFYEMEMPIRCELFDHNLAQVIQTDRVALLGR
jgi:trafficking protein particle complex subunit 4